MEFHGCYFHGHDCHLTKAHNGFNSKVGKSFQTLSEETQERTAYLKSFGYTVVEMRECEWYHMKRQNPNIQLYLDTIFPPRKDFFGHGAPYSEEELLKAVIEKDLFGLVLCDVNVPEEHREKFSEMTPVFKNVNVSREDIGVFMQEYTQDHNLLKQPRRTLIGSYFGKQILLTTPLLKWYVAHGLSVSNVTEVIEYRPRACFERFADTVSNNRRAGDLDPKKGILAETFKVLGNSAYGKTLEDVGRHRSIVYVEGSKAGKLINNPLFRKCTSLSDELIEVESVKREVLWNLPLQIGFFVYQYAKLKMLQFHYDFLDRFISRADYQLCEMDTDSLYMALSADSLEKLVSPHDRKIFFEEYPKWFPTPACEKHLEDFKQAHIFNREWVPCTCCMSEAKFQKRTPGLFKEEWSGDGIVALCSKTYYCFSGDGGKDKFSCKGLNKHTNTITKDMYLNVLASRTSGGGLNRGFRVVREGVYTYEQQRQSLSYLYIKRKVSKDDVSTEPLDI